MIKKTLKELEAKLNLMEVKGDLTTVHYNHGEIGDCQMRYTLDDDGTIIEEIKIANYNPRFVTRLPGVKETVEGFAAHILMDEQVTIKEIT